MRYSLASAAAAGVTRLRDPAWACPLDHGEIHAADGKLGPWFRLWAPMNSIMNGRDPVAILVIGPDIDIHAESFVEYAGPLPDSDEYRAEVARCEQYREHVEPPAKPGTPKEETA